MLFSLNAIAFTGIVTSVHDGDTLTVLNEKNVKENIRITKIDTPEEPYKLRGQFIPKQPYADEARDALKELCLGKQAEVRRVGKSYSRSVAFVSCGGVDVTEYQLKNGNAWFYRYSTGRAFKAMAAEAKAAKLGLWADPAAVEPYLWRRGKR